MHETHNTLKKPLPPHQKNPFQSIAPPRKLRVDQILTRSIIISWVTPSSESLDFVIDEYRILVDGKLRTIVEGTQTNAVIESIERKPDKVYSIAVQAVASDGRLSLADKCLIKWPDRNVIHLEEVKNGGSDDVVINMDEGGRKNSDFGENHHAIHEIGQNGGIGQNGVSPWTQNEPETTNSKNTSKPTYSTSSNQTSSNQKFKPVQKQSITQNSDHIRIHFTPNNTESPHDLFLNDEQIARLVRNQSSYRAFKFFEIW